jgi:anti-sigma B factor antagonist
MEINSYEKNGIAIIELEGRLDAGAAPKLKNKFRELSVKQHNFVFDLKKMEYVDSTGLGCIVACLKTVSEQNGDVKLACLQDKPRIIFEITRAYKIFDIFDDLDAAVGSFIQ